MGKRVILSIDDLAAIMNGNTTDEAGNIILSEAGSAAVIHAVSLALRRKSGKPRKPPVQLKKPEVLKKYKDKMTAYMTDHPDAGIEEVSEEIGLSHGTVGNNPELSEWYEKLLSIASLASPSTVSNDPDYDFDNDD